MAQLQTIAIGRPPSKRVSIPIAGTTVEVGLRVLSAAERTQAFRRAKAAAKESGVESWDENDPICALELYVEIVAAAAFDAEDPNEKEPWATAEQLRESHAIGQEVLLFLHEAYVALEQGNSPRLHKLSPKEQYELIWSLVNRDFSPLVRLPLATLWSFMHSLAVLAVSSPSDRSSSSLDTESKEPSTN